MGRRLLWLLLPALLLPGCRRADPASSAGAFSLSAEDVLAYFCEIAFGSELGEGSAGICKWTEPIVLALAGNFTPADEETIGRLTDTLNGIGGFPGIRRAEPGEEANMTFSFLPRVELQRQFATAEGNCDGISEYTWSRTDGHILSARAAVDEALTGERQAVIAEEFLQALGLARDSLWYPSSIFYQRKCTSAEPTALDWALVRLLYQETLRPGMEPGEALPVLRALTAAWVA